MSHRKLRPMSLNIKRIPTPEMWKKTPTPQRRKKRSPTRTEKKIRKDSVLRKFSRDAYFYVNQLFGDISLRSVIQESMRGKGGWKMVHMMLSEDNRDFRGGAHHFLKGPKNKTWDSLEVGLQDMRCHPNDTLCQTYSIAKYLNVLKTSDEVLKSPKTVFGHNYLLTRSRQFKLIEALRKTLGNPSVVEQLHYSCTLKMKGGWFMQGIDAKYRKKSTVAKRELVAKIRSVLTDWRDFGWKHYDQNKKYSKKLTPFYNTNTPRRSHIKKSIMKRKSIVRNIARRDGNVERFRGKNTLHTPSGAGSRTRVRYKRGKIKF